MISLASYSGSLLSTSEPFIRVSLYSERLFSVSSLTARSLFAIRVNEDALSTNGAVGACLEGWALAKNPKVSDDSKCRLTTISRLSVLSAL